MTSMQRTRIVVGILTLSVLLSGRAAPDIFRWDNGQLIPGTAGITPGPGVQLARMDLQYAELSGINLTNADFEDSDLTRADFYYATLSGADLTRTDLAGAKLGRLRSGSAGHRVPHA